MLLGLVGSEGGILIVSADDGLGSWLRSRWDTVALEIRKEAEDVVGEATAVSLWEDLSLVLRLCGSVTAEDFEQLIDWLLLINYF